jgi:hypothetical protein
VKREINEQVYFLYFDDLNNYQTDLDIKRQLANTCETFFPESEIWINCRALTYHPHSNKCGLIILLALTIMMLHPQPSPNILSPNYMQMDSSNTSHWRANFAPISMTGQCTQPGRWTVTSNPYLLIQWAEIIFQQPTPTTLSHHSSTTDIPTVGIKEELRN